MKLIDSNERSDGGSGYLLHKRTEENKTERTERALISIGKLCDPNRPPALRSLLEIMCSWDEQASSKLIVCTYVKQSFRVHQEQQ